MLKRQMSIPMSARTNKPIAIVLCTLSLFVLIVSLAACTSTTKPVVSLNQNAAMAQTLDQSAFVVRDLVVTPVNVSKGEAVTIIANVINTGAKEGVYNAELKINNARVLSQAVTIPSGVTQTLNFTVPASSLGTYEATFGGLKGTFAVIDGAGNPIDIIPGNDVNNSANTSADTFVPSCCSTTQATTNGSSVGGCCGSPTTTTAPSYGGSTFPTGGGGCCGR